MLIPVRNPTEDTLKVAPGEVIGSVDVFEVDKDAEPESIACVDYMLYSLCFTKLSVVKCKHIIDYQ